MKTISEKLKEVSAEYYPQVHPNIIHSLALYYDKGIKGGSFLNAVLCNDLFDAMGRADDYNKRTIADICGLIYNALPSDCYGSVEKVQDFINSKGV